MTEAQREPSATKSSSPPEPRGGSGRALQFLKWGTVERVLVTFVGAIGALIVVRHLGPSGAGQLGTAAAVLAVVEPLITLGGLQIAYRELLRSDANRHPGILGMLLTISVVGSMLAAAVGTLVAFLGTPDAATRNMALVFLATLALSPWTQLTVWLDVKRQIRPLAMARVATVLIFLGARILFVMFDAAPWHFVWMALAERIVATAGVYAAYKVSRGPAPARPHAIGSLGGWLSESVWWLVASLSVTLYLKVDLLMLANLRTTAEVGIYSAAVRISEAAYFIPLLLVGAAMPRVAVGTGPQLIRDMGKLSEVVMAAGVCIALVTTVMATWLTGLLLGSAYAGTASVLVIHTWAILFVGLGTVRGRWELLTGRHRGAAVARLAGAGVNVGLNYVMIPRWGAQGAAWATLVSYAVAAWLSTLWMDRAMFVAQCRAMVGWMLPHRLADSVRWWRAQ